MAEIFDGVIWWESLCEISGIRQEKPKEHGIIKGILLHQGKATMGKRTGRRKWRKSKDLLCDLDLKEEEVPMFAGGNAEWGQKGGVCAGTMNMLACCRGW